MKPKHSYFESNGVLFPVTTFENGLTIMDYPPYNPELAKNITEEGKKRIREMGEMTRKFMEDYEIKIILNDKEY
jgi:hypothetical protein